MLDSVKSKVIAGSALLAGVGSAFAAEGDMVTYADPSAAITAIGQTASSAFGTFSGTIVPMLLGALVLVGGLQLGKWIIKKIRP